METYLTFFTPRDKEPSLSSSEEKSSEFDWLERKLTRKQKYIRKTEQVLCILLSCKTVQRMRLSEQALEIDRSIYDRYMFAIFYIGSKIYIERRYFLRKIPIISLTNYKEKIEIYTKYIEKKI